VISTLPATVREFAGEVVRYLLNQHKPNGGHANVTADSLTLNGALILTSDTPSELTATIANYAPTNLATTMVLRLKASGAISLRGLTPVANRLLGVRNLGANNITLEHEDTGATANYRFQLPNSADVVLGQYDGVLLWYDDVSKRWTCFQQ
jgi:hypothetical protein